MGGRRRGNGSEPAQPAQRECTPEGKQKLRAYMWWGRRIAVVLCSLEDSYLAGRGSIVAAIVACACAVGVASYLGHVPAIESNGLLAGVGPAPQRLNFSREECGRGLNATTAARAMLLSAHFLLYNQRPQGNFIERYNWTGRLALAPLDDDDAQGAAVWALAAFYREVRATHVRHADVYPKGLQTRLHEAVTNGFTFFETNSRQTKSGARYIAYPGKSVGQLCVIAQVILAIVEFKRALSSGAMPKGVNLNAPTFQQTSQAWTLDRTLREHTDFLLRMRLPNGRFVRTYELSGRPRKQHTAKMHDPHAESLALLALVSVIKHGGRGDLLQLAQRSAEALFKAYEPPREDDSPGGTGGAPGNVALGQDVKALDAQHDSVRFFRYSGLALAELADISDAPPGLLSAQDALKEAPSSWAAKSLLLGGWQVVVGLTKTEQHAKRAKKESQGADQTSQEGASGREERKGAEPEFIEDAAAVKPAGWQDNEMLYIADPGAQRPAGWRDEEDGVWEPPVIPNPKCRKGMCGKWTRPLVRNPKYVKASAGDPGGRLGHGVVGRPAAAAAVASRVAWSKSMGKGVDLEDELGKGFACQAARAVAATGRRQVGGPFAADSSARAAPARFGANRPETYGFKFNSSKCHGHVRKSVSGSVSVRRDKAARALVREAAEREKARQIHITPGQGVTLADMLRQSLGEGEKEKQESRELSECQRAKDAHDRCTNDNPVGSHGFKNCCRALGGYLFGCIEDRALLPQHLRALYAPSYAVYCATEGHAELPPDFVSGYVAERSSEFEEDKRAAADDACDLAALGGIKEEDDFRILGIKTAAHYLFSTVQVATHLLRGR